MSPASTPFMALACPLDGAALARRDGCWQCAAGHTFDIASQGYVNLLPVQHKRSRDPGDSKEMVVARRRFLEAGHYQPIADAISAATLDAATLNAPAQAGPLACLDAGCGEGYYLRALAAAGAAGTLSLIGLDISKWAVLAAARKDGDATWVVGSNARLPILSATLDRVLCLFGFPVHAEFARVLKPGGVLLQLDAGPAHLRALRQIIYPQLKAERATELGPPAGFELLDSSTLQFDFEVGSQAAIADLLTMTPHLYRTSPAGRERAAALTRIALGADVRLTRYRRIAAA
ncbi:MAG TPA: methyltransferase domain-containing protein [Thauera sp.]|nr:methyltransferase domain-containing protein [Thauera sp.]